MSFRERVETFQPIYIYSMIKDGKLEMRQNVMHGGEFSVEKAVSSAIDGETVWISVTMEDESETEIALDEEQVRETIQALEDCIED